MSALAPRNSHVDESDWVESSDVVDYLPASIWALDYEEEDDETTLPGRRLARYSALMSPEINQEAPIDTPRQVRVLDESQVLPREASFATVRLNQPLAESTLKPQHSREAISIRSVAYDRERLSPSRVTVLDESAVLPGEASFATVISDEDTPAHSPMAELLVKTKLTMKQLALAVLALVSVLALSLIVLARVTSSVLETVSAAPPHNPVSQPATTSQSAESVLTSDLQGDVSGRVSSKQPVATVEEAPMLAEPKPRAGSRSNSSLRTTASDAKPAAVHQESLREINPVGERVSSRKEHDLDVKKQLDSVSRKALKKPEAANTSHASVKSQPRESNLQLARKPVSTQSAVPVTVEKVETKTPLKAAGAERPRIVGHKPSP